MNDEGKICTHHFTGQENGYWIDEGLADFYLLMRKTLEPNETLEQALYRGLQEEFGASSDINDYLGSIQSHFVHEGVTVEKTTIYFLCKLRNQDLSKRRKSDVEGQTEIEWQTPDFLISKMQQQAKKYRRTDVDESAILAKVLL